MKNDDHSDDEVPFGDDANHIDSSNAEVDMPSVPFYLHRILQYDPKPSVVELCFQSDPEATKKCNKQKELPLNVACSYGVSVEVLYIIIQRPYLYATLVNSCHCVVLVA